MTADAKVGLLLGLVFIVMIAFLINGLPHFLKTASPDDMVTTSIAMPTTQELVIDDRVVDAARNLDGEALPGSAVPPKEVAVTEDSSVSLTDNQPDIASELGSPSPEPVATAPAQPQPVLKEQKSQPAGRVHVVKQGESLAAIAQKYYGKEEGNSRAAIQKLYEANRDVLASPDKVRAGEKLTIPYPPERQNVKPQTAAATDPQTSLMNKFTGIFERPKESVKTRAYVIQKGDNLWSIAQKTLGDGKRYKEIAQLNPGVNSDDLVIGKTLKIPGK